MSDETKKWRVTDSAYRMSFDHQPIVIYYCPNPGGTKHEDGTTSYSLSFPALLMSEYVTEPEKAAQAICDALNRDESRDGFVSLPRKLTAENGAKAALIGEFYEECVSYGEEDQEITVKVPVTWTTIKQIWDAAVAHFEAQANPPPQTAPAKPQE